jgi:hypothetical protein
MKSVFFRPWVGDDYQRGFRGRRVLVLGESHYQWDDKIPAYEDLTIDCIKEQLSGEHSKFWTNIAITFLNAHPSPAEKRAFWSSVAFYNYVQEFAGFGPRVRPSDQSWERSEPAFWEVLDALRPECVIALGYRLWARMPDRGERGPDIASAPQQWTWWYPIPMSDARVLAYAIRHPSSGFSGTTWHPYVMSALSRSVGGQAATRGAREAQGPIDNSEGRRT